MNKTKEACKAAIPEKAAQALIKVRDAILAHPRQVDMASFVYKKYGCGTVGCIAGWCAILHAEGPISEDRADELNDNADIITREITGITEVQCDKLFYDEEWPDVFQRQLSNLDPGTKAYAKVVAARIDHFIQTGE